MTTHAEQRQEQPTNEPVPPPPRYATKVVIIMILYRVVGQVFGKDGRSSSSSSSGSRNFQVQLVSHKTCRRSWTRFSRVPLCRPTFALSRPWNTYYWRDKGTKGQKWQKRQPRRRRRTRTRGSPRLLAIIMICLRGAYGRDCLSPLNGSVRSDQQTVSTQSHRNPFQGFPFRPRRR